MTTFAANGALQSFQVVDTPASGTYAVILCELGDLHDRRLTPSGPRAKAGEA
jgi:hypothetical protein